MSRVEWQTIWLQPWCYECEMSSIKNGGEGRLWCQDNPWDDCPCGATPVLYRIDPKSQETAP